MQPQWIDYTVIVIYFISVLGIGYLLRNFMKTSTDFFLSGRSIPAWITGLAFLSANLGAQEVIGMAASGAKYGIATSHFYWVGAVPAMLFVGIFMMPFYYGSRARSVPEYLKLRFDEKTRGLNAISFAAMTVFSSGVSMYAMGKLLQLLLGWDFNFSIIISALIVLAYTFLGGLTSAIYNEVLQFFLIVIGFIPLVFLGLMDVGGWDGLQAKLATVAVSRGYEPGALTDSWKFMSEPSANPMGVEWFSLVMGLGFVLSFGYWCTDFLVVQRAMAADSMTSARRTPLIAAFPKMIFPFLVILPGMLAISVGSAVSSPNQREKAAVAQSATTTQSNIPMQGIIPAKVDDKTGQVVLDSNGKPQFDYDLAIPKMLEKYFPSGLLGIGLCALLASFMSGMAGNTTAFNTVWTYDIYQSYINRHASDQHYLWMGRMATIFGLALSIAAAYVASQFNNIMDVLQLVFAFVNAPLFATFMLGMFWKRATGHGAFLGLLAGIMAAAAHHGLTLPAGSTAGVKGGFFGPILQTYPSEMAQNFWTAIFAWTTCFIVTIVISLLTKPRADEELRGLVYALTPKPKDEGLRWYQKPSFLALAVIVLLIMLNLIFW
ncbi:MAG: sodium:solute symporter family protein [Acidobacteria bacterium]|nr:sodium:solute symporter family protein [Acidobacteriota bacterium]